MVCDWLGLLLRLFTESPQTVSDGLVPGFGSTADTWPCSAEAAGGSLVGRVGAVSMVWLTYGLVKTA